MPDLAPVVTLESVTVTYGRNPALRDVTASFAPGAVGLLGPNGAGKSTMLKALLGFIVPERGRMRVLGYDVAASPLDIRARVGYMPESDAHIPGMNAVSFVAYCGELAGLPRVDAMQRAHEVLFYGALAGFVGRLRAAGLDCHASDEDVMRVFVPGEGGARELFALAAAEGVQVRHLRPSVPTLEDVFAHAVGEE